MQMAAMATSPPKMLTVIMIVLFFWVPFGGKTKQNVTYKLCSSMWATLIVDFKPPSPLHSCINVYFIQIYRNVLAAYHVCLDVMHITPLDILLPYGLKYLYCPLLSSVKIVPLLATINDSTVGYHQWSPTYITVGEGDTLIQSTVNGDVDFADEAVSLSPLCLAQENGAAKFGTVIDWQRFQWPLTLSEPGEVDILGVEALQSAKKQYTRRILVVHRQDQIWKNCYRARS